MEYLTGQADLVARDGRWYLYATIDISEREIQAAKACLGLDMGAVNIDTMSERVVDSGAQVEAIRVRRTSRGRRRSCEARRQHKHCNRSRSVRRD